MRAWETCSLSTTHKRTQGAPWWMQRSPALRSYLLSLCLADCYLPYSSRSLLQFNHSPQSLLLLLPACVHTIITLSALIHLYGARSQFGTYAERRYRCTLVLEGVCVFVCALWGSLQRVRDQRQRWKESRLMQRRRRIKRWNDERRSRTGDGSHCQPFPSSTSCTLQQIYTNFTGHYHLKAPSQCQILILNSLPAVFIIPPSPTPLSSLVFIFIFLPLYRTLSSVSHLCSHAHMQMHILLPPSPLLLQHPIPQLGPWRPL